MRKLLFALGIGCVLLIAGYFILQGMVRRKIDATLKTLPDSMTVTYGSLQSDLFGGRLILTDVRVKDGDRRVSIQRMSLGGLSYFSLAAGRRHISVGHLALSGIKLEEGRLLAMEGGLELDSIEVANKDHPMDSLQMGRVALHADKLTYLVPGGYEKIRLKGLKLDSRTSTLDIDTLQVDPTIDREQVGTRKGRQVDVVEAGIEGIQIKGLDVMALLRRRLVADVISIRKHRVHVFRDRRLPRVKDRKPMPVDYLKSLPIAIRVGEVRFGEGSFEYEEFPGKGEKTGMLKIFRLHGTVKAMTNRPVEGDPAYITVFTEGSLMGSGSVNSTIKMPLHKGVPYHVEGAFHELDVTKLNPSAENLGNIHLESGMLNSLAFRFDMDEERATGNIVGEYHDLVVDKHPLFLTKLIIPRDKDHSLPLSKRTGKVDYKHEPDRNFSYYMLHALLVGVKSSFSLGFLLPG